MDNETITCSQEDFEIVASDANMMTIVASTVESCQEGIILGNEIGNDTVEETANNNLPVTLVVSEPSVLAHINQNANTDSSTHEEPVISTVSLQDGETNAQYFIEHITSNGSQIQTTESGTIQIGVNPTENIEDQDCVPILLHVEEGISSNQADIHIPQAEGGDHMSLSTTLGTDDMSETMYTIHLTEDQPPEGIISDEQGTLTTSNSDLTVSDPPTAHLEHVTLSEDSNLHFLATSSRLEDFMDVVTTYKCKFCRFSCAWKSGLMSHIRSCHLETSILPITQPSNTAVQLEDIALKQNTNESANDDNRVISEDFNSTAGENKETIILLNASDSHPKSNDVSCLNDNELDLASSNSSPPHPPPQECHIYLCGQCSKAFNCLDGCKQHMIKDHSIKMDISSKKSRPKSQGHSHTTPALNSSNCLLDDEEDEEEDDYNDDVAETDVDTNNLDGNCRDDDNDLSESSGKRRIRPPRALEEDYYLGTKKKRVRRQSMTDRTFRCNKKGCGYRFTTEANLQYHSRCHSVGNKPFTCPECSEKCDHWRGLVIHLWKQHCIDMDLHTCPICGYKTFSLFKLDNHKRIHSDEREFICTTCGKGFKQLSQLRNHNVIHLDRKNLSEKRWYSEQECDICHRTFSDSKCLRKHQQAVHNKLKPYVCSYCGHMSARKAMLQLHMRQHTGEKPFKCDHCDYRTGDHNSLRRHRMRHTGKKPYRCPHCSYACIQAISYKMHLKNKHPGMEGLYACSLCTFRSVSKENYINHMSDHKRGVVQTASTSNFNINNNEQNSLANEEGNDNQAAQESAQLHVTEGTLQQLQGILPGNLSAAQFICSCLNALGQEGGTINLPAGITTTTTARDGTQTITIQLPASAQENLEQEQFYLTIQHQDNTTPTTIVTPNIRIQDVHTVTTSDSTDTLAILQPIVTQDDSGQPLDTSAFVTADGDSATVVIASNADVPTETESATSLLQEVSPC